MIFFKKKKQEDVGPPIELNALGGLGPEIQRREIDARQIEQLVPLKEMLYDALIKRVDRIMLDYTRDAVAAQYMIDGLWHTVDPRDPLDLFPVHVPPPPRRWKKSIRSREDFL